MARASPLVPYINRLKAFLAPNKAQNILIVVTARATLDGASVPLVPFISRLQAFLAPNYVEFTFNQIARFIDSIYFVVIAYKIIRITLNFPKSPNGLFCFIKHFLIFSCKETTFFSTCFQKPKNKSNAFDFTTKYSLSNIYIAV